MLLKIEQLLATITYHDVFEIACCMFISHALLHIIHEKHSLESYTFFYCAALGIPITWIFAYKIICSTLILGALSYYLLITHQSHHKIRVAPVITYKEKEGWVEHILGLSIQAFHENISLVWLIDREEELHPLVTSELRLNVSIVPKLSTIIFSAINVHTRTATLWVNKYGHLIGINPINNLTSQTPSILDIMEWSKSKEVIALISYPLKRNYSVCYNSVFKESLSSHHAYHIVKQALTFKQSIQSQETL